MARPQKEGLDYFSLDVDMDQDDKIRLIEAKFKLAGFAILVKLLMKIYKEGYYYQWTEREQLLFADYINEDISLINDVVIEAVKWEFFCPSLYEKHNILTSKGIQKRYLTAAKKRKEITMFEEYFLVEEKDIPQNTTITFVSVIKCRVNSSETPVNEELIPKGKKRRVKESKEKNIYGEKVHLAEDEYQKLIEQHGEEATKQMIAILDNWYLTKGKPPNNSDYHTMVGVGWVFKKYQDEQKDQHGQPRNKGKPKDEKYKDFYL